MSTIKLCTATTMKGNPCPRPSILNGLCTIHYSKEYIGGGNE